MRSDSRFSAGLAVVYLVLLMLAIPWYWPADETRLLFGLPIWVVTALLIGFATACLTAWILCRRPWVEVDDKDEKR